jgi:flavin-dependent dehydrogenase
MVSTGLREVGEKLKIAIAGAGMTGAYLYRMLKRQGHRVDIFDVRAATRCGLHPCAWGTSKGFTALVAAAGLEPQKYILQKLDHVIIDGVKIKAELKTFDKPGLIGDLLQGAEVSYAPFEPAIYERVIDATGVARAFLPPIADDIILPCEQKRVRAAGPLENRIMLDSIGYSWCFPLGEDQYHIGGGSLAAASNPGLKNRKRFLCDQGETLCGCRGNVRLTSPHGALPFVVDQGLWSIWGVGEAIGCVAPLAGDGVVPGMQSVRILIDHWQNREAYTDAILQEFSWMKQERQVIERLRRRKHLGISAAWVLKKNSRRMGMDVPLKDALRLLKNLKPA